MNTLQVNCKHKDYEKEETVLQLDLVNGMVDVLPEWQLEGGDCVYWSFENLEWIDFGTQRWYPNNL